MDGFIVTLALPAMARHFGVGIHEIKWVNAFVVGQSRAFQVAAALGLAGAFISAIRGADRPAAASAGLPVPPGACLGQRT